MAEEAARLSLYRKWRSRTFAELVGQEHVTRTLRNAVRQDRLSHAYVFCGPRGVGKTSAARILAKAANCQSPRDGEPCDACEVCQSIAAGEALDVIEIDAASNRGIDDVRALRETVGFRPGLARFRFYILDEAHMLSNEAFNALLKTLEEPPPHAIFILVTTEASRLPATVLSRCQRFDFHRIPLATAIDRLRHIAVAEGVAATPAALELIAHGATGSLRDAEMLLDQIMAAGEREIEVRHVEALIGSSGIAAAATLVDRAIDRDVAGGIRHLNMAIAEGVEPRQLAREVVEHLRNVTLFKLSGSASLVDVGPERLAAIERQAERADAAQLVAALRAFSGLEGRWRESSHHRLPLELAFLEVATPDAAPSTAPAPTAPRGVAPVRPATTPAATEPRRDAAPHPTTPPPRPPAVAPLAKVPPDQLWDHLSRRWSEVVESLGQSNRPLQALVRSAQPDRLEGATLHLKTRYAFHRERIEDARNRAALEQAIIALFGHNVRVSCRLADADAESTPPPDTDGQALGDPLVRAAIEMGARVTRVTPLAERESAG